MKIDMFLYNNLGPYYIQIIKNGANCVEKRGQEFPVSKQPWAWGSSLSRFRTVALQSLKEFEHKIL